MIKVGLIGFGFWGKILYKKLEKFCDVKFTCRSKDTYLDKLDDVDWIVVATPNDTHFDIVRNCLWAGKNVFCEKPLTPTYEQSEKLFRTAKLRNVKLYVDDVQNFREVKWDLMKHNFIERKKKDNFSYSYYKKNNYLSSNSLFYRLTYHDIYYLYEYIKNLEIEEILPIDVKNKLHFKVKFNNLDIEFVYDTNYEHERVHNINGVSLMGDGEDDPVYDMLKKVLSGDVDFEYNKEISLFTNKFIDTLNEFIKFGDLV
jgi:hypothetical protein